MTLGKLKQLFDAADIVYDATGEVNHQINWYDICRDVNVETALIIARVGDVYTNYIFTKDALASASLVDNVVTIKELRGGSVHFISFWKLTPLKED